MLGLRPVGTADYPFLFEIRNNLNDLHLWSVRRHILPCLDDFVAEFEYDLRNDKHIFLIVEYEGRPIGFVFSYSPQFIDGNCYATIYLVPEARVKGLGPFAMGRFLIYLFNTFNFHKVYFDVYSYNQLSLSTLRTFGASEEGLFKEHRFWGGKRHDMIRLATYSSNKNKIIEALNRISKRFDK